jgi:hypothetical protein
VLSNRALLRQRMGGDPVVVLAEALEAAFLLDRFTAVVTLVRSNQRTFDDQVVAKAKARLHLTPEQDATVDRVIRDVRAGAASIVGRLERHLRLCASLCSQHHAELVLLLYPEPIGLEHVVRRVGQAGLATVIDPQPRFAAALKKKKWSDLFVADGHCNDAGYAILADLVFQDLQKRTRR